MKLERQINRVNVRLSRENSSKCYMYMSHVKTPSQYVQLFSTRSKLSLGLLGRLGVTLKRGHGGSGVGVGVVLLECHLDVVLQVEGRLGVVCLGLEVHNEIILHSEDGVDGEVGVVAGVDLVDDRGVFGVGDHQVDVSGTHGRSVHELEKDTGGAVGRQGVGSGVVAVPVEFSLLVGAELAAEIVIGLGRVLEVVLAVGRGLPDVEDCADDRLAGLHVLNGAVHESDTAIRLGILDDAVAEGAEGGVGGPERAENDVGSRGDAVLGDDLVGDLINKTNEIN